MTQIAFLSSITLPSPLANRQYVMSMCEAFAQVARVSLFVNSFLKSMDEIFEFYNVRPCFEIRQVGPVWRPRSFWLGRRYAAILGQERPDIAYMCEVRLLRFLQSFGPKVEYVYETEDEPLELKRHVCRLNATRAVVCYNAFRKNALVEIGVDPAKILVAPSGVNLGGYVKPAPQKVLRQELGLPMNVKIVMYAGHFHPWKGTDVLVRSAKFLNAHAVVYLVGGTEGDAQQIRSTISSAGAENVCLVPFQPPRRVPKFLQAADVLVLPNTSASANSIYYTSPLKLFQYMASGRPIVASDLPSLREILGPHNAFIVKPDDPEALAGGIRQALEDQAEAGRRTERAWEQVREYTWEKRAKRILEFLARQEPN